MFIVLVLTGCSTNSSPDIINQTILSENRNDRVRFVIIHYTSGNWADSLQVLTKPSDTPVSAHYLIPESADHSYPTDQALAIYQLVPEKQRAWHAGQSRWEDRIGLNDHSIGIELVNRSQCFKSAQTAHLFCEEKDFDPAQMQLVALLLKQILARYPDITPTRVLGHSDIVPDRKQDPGSRFPWQWLAAQGIGAWYDSATVMQFVEEFSQNGIPDVRRIQSALRDYGYAIALTGEEDAQHRQFIIAFQRHFVPDQISGQADLKTVAILWALLKKYFPEKLAKPSSVPTKPV